MQHALNRHARVGIDAKRIVAEGLLDLERRSVWSSVLVNRHAAADYRSVSTADRSARGQMVRV
jgi:hypothetical protein